MSRATKVRVESGLDKDETVDPRSEQCPVCKTSRYMRPNMLLLINPICYHKMCESCADRLFGHGPGQCPILGCHHVLRRNKFRKQTFEDIKVEREVDIRRRVAEIFSRTEEDFESLRDWNDYLNDVEDITFNMINGIDVEETQKRFEAYERVHQEEVRRDARPEEQEQMDFIAKTSNKPTKETIKKRPAVKSEPSTTNGSSNLTIKGLKTKPKPVPVAPIDPFGGITFVPRYYSLQDEYDWSGLRTFQSDKRSMAGGYSIPGFANRALCEAFAGLGVLIGEETQERDVRMEDVKVVKVDVEDSL